MKFLLALVLIFVAFNKAEYTTYTATAYSIHGRTASGHKTAPGIIAADWRILPNGSKVEIKGMGIFTVRDTGGAIKGRRIDIWMPSRKEAIKFGRRKVQLRKL